MSDPIDVPEIRVRVTTGPACYAQENGFSAIYAEILTTDRELVKRLSENCGGTPVTIRCAMLDAIGPITKSGGGLKGEARFVLQVTDLVYRNPSQKARLRTSGREPS